MRAIIGPCHLAVFLLAGAALGAGGANPPFIWQQDHARVTTTGDIEWTPREFRFVTGASVRYIDFANGADANDGASRDRPWKHHPWDAHATSRAAAGGGNHTYVFKGGVDYRGLLTVRDHGEPGNPIRLTRDPDWGEGPARILGSERVTGWTRGATHADIPEPDHVWWADIDFAPRSVWMVQDDDTVLRLPLARTPNWTPHPDDHLEQWWSWTNDRAAFFTTDSGPVAYDSVNIKGKDPGYFENAIIRSEFGWVMGTPYPTRVTSVEPETGGIEFGRWTGGRAGGAGNIIFRGMRYYLEDKPHYLDDPGGEFWFDRQGGGGGRLYLRLPGDADPNRVRIEAGKRTDLILGRDVRHLEISGLDFRFATAHWDLEVVSWDFRTRPWGYREQARPAFIRVWGDGHDIRIAHNRFQDGVLGIVMFATPGDRSLDHIRIEDNRFGRLDVGLLSLSCGAGWGFTQPAGYLGDVRVDRNYGHDIGHRPDRYSRGTAMDFSGARTLHVAGNVLERLGGQGINVYGGKHSGQWGDIPFTRTLVHQNKVWQSLQISNDFGGIEAWQHGPIYIFNNLSYDARGMWEGRRRHHGSSPGFGHAYYLDGAFKCYLFNNIAWGRSNDPTTKLVNCAAFQEIYSYQNAFFNNTAYNYFAGSRRQSPHAGRNKYQGNVFQAISDMVFRHADPARTAAEGNAADAGPQKSHFAYETNAYGRNVFHDIAMMGVFEASGRWLKTLEDFRDALNDRQSLATELGVMDDVPPLRDPAAGDFRLNPDSAAVDRGAVVFVPWALHGVVGEWHFHHAGNDPARIIDEHWYAKDYYTERSDYHNMPMYPLTAVNVQADDYEQGKLDNWTRGVLRFNPERKQYAVLSNERMMRDIRLQTRIVSRHFGNESKIEEVVISGRDIKNPQIWDSNLLIEIYFRADPGASGLLVGKMGDTGYRLRVDDSGKAVFRLAGEGGVAAEVASRTTVNDGSWRHLLVEADRDARTLTIYVDGRLDSAERGLGAASLANDADLYVAGTPSGDCFAGRLQFLRIAQGTLAEADTTIEELYAWQFDGPALRDMRGNPPQGKARDAGAIESY